MSALIQQGSLFDYDALEAIHRDPIQRAKVEIATLFNRSVRNFIKIGQKLTDVRGCFPSVELFSRWFEVEFNQSQRTAYNLMRLAERFQDADDEAIARFGISTLYELAAASVPEAARKAALQLAASGTEVTPEIADAIIEQAKQAEETDQGSFFVDEPGVGAHIEPTPDVNKETEYLLGPDCLCRHPPANHPDASMCMVDHCSCDCYQTERADHSNVETLASVTETTTTKTQTNAVVEAAPDPIAQMKGEADIIFDASTINLAITIFPKNGDDRDCMVWVKSGDVSVQSMCKHSQLQDALAAFTLAQQMLALKVQLYENAEAKKKAGKTPVATAKTSTTKSTAKKGKK